MAYAKMPTAPPFLLLLLLSTAFAAVFSDLTSDRAALISLHSAVGRYLKWNVSDSSPCRWPGVNCTAGRVSELRLPGVSLMGTLPPGTVGNLTDLRTLSLRFNRLSGALPSDLGAISGLRNLYLQGNQFSGEIPDFIFSLTHLVRLNLASNNFSGEISPSFNNLTRLGTLYLENNQLSGSLPDLNLTNLGQFNVSNNHLNGSIPAGLRDKQAGSFIGNTLCGGPLSPCVGSGAGGGDGGGGGGGSGGKKHHKGLSGGAIVGIVVAAVVVFLLLLLVLFFCCCRSKSNPKTRAVDLATVAKPPDAEAPRESAGDKAVPPNGTHNAAAAAVPAAAPKATVSDVGAKKLIFFGSAARAFDLEDLLRASAEVLGKGTFGTAYKAVLEMGTMVAVKRLRDVTIPEREFREKIEVVGGMDHENLVPLRAYYFSKDEKLLVYDHLPNGSLSALLHGNRGAGRTPLNWETRSGIAVGVAKGVEYLHSQGPDVSHGNIKSSNVLLTKDYDARVSDFGLAHLIGPAPNPNRVAGYRAPEVTDARRVSQKADVYSFGVLLLELLTGKAPTHAILNEEGVDLPRWVQSVVREEWTSEVFDLELLRYQNVEEEMVRLLQLAIDCCAQYPDNRPTMQEVVRRIEELRQSTMQTSRATNGSDDVSSKRTDAVDGSAPPQPPSQQPSLLD